MKYVIAFADETLEAWRLFFWKITPTNSIPSTERNHSLWEVCFSQEISNGTEWHTSVIPAVERVKLGDLEFEASLDYTARLFIKR